MGRKVVHAVARSLPVLAFFAGCYLSAQPATTTVADQFYTAVGPSFCTGTFTLSWTDFYSADGFLIKAGTSAAIAVNAMGQFSVNVVPTNTTTTPATGIYTVRYNLQPANCAPATEYWNVPTTNDTVNLNQVRTLPSPPPSLIPPASIAPPTTPGNYCFQYINGIVEWNTSCSSAGASIVGTARQIKVVTTSGTTTLSIPPDLLLSGQSANGTDVLSGSRFTDTSPTGNFMNFKSVAGASLWRVDIGGTLQAGTIPFVRLSILASDVVGLFSGCSGTQYLGADGACHSGGTGSVTSFSAGTLSPLFTTTVNTATTTPALIFTASTAAQNSFLAGPSSGGTGAYSFRAIIGADLPNPSATTLGGVQSKTAVTHQFLNTISTSGVPGSAQPAFSDLSGSAACSQQPALTGDATSSAGSCATTVVQVNGAVIPASASGLKSNAGRQVLAQTAADVVAQFSGCSGTQYLGADGACHTASGGGGATRGTFASRASCSTSGATYYSTDVPIVSECNGTSWADFVFGRPVTLPYLTTFSGFNMSGATITTNGVMILNVATASGINLHGQQIAYPATPFTLDACFVFDRNLANGDTGLYVTDGTKIVTFEWGASANPPVLGVVEWNNTTSFASTVGTVNTAFSPPHCFRWADAGAGTTTFSTSADGFTYLQRFSYSTTSFLTPTNIGWVTDLNDGTYATATTLFHWSLH